MIITKNGTKETVHGPEVNFVGDVLVTMLFNNEEPSRAAAARVTFTPGARTNWHTHPVGQTLIITEGVGWVQRENGPKKEVHPGDVVWFPPGEKHWHGATENNSMTHTAIQENEDGEMVEWLEPVSDKQFQS